MKRIAVLPVSLLLAACASTSAIPESRDDRSIVAVQTNAGSSELQLTRQAAISSSGLAAPPDSVWAALPEVYADLGIPVTGIDTGTRLLVSAGQRIRRIGGQSMSRYFNCPGPYGNLAASGDVYVTVRTQVLSGEAGAGSLVRTHVDAFARSSAGNSQTRCSATGALENLIAKELGQRVGGG